MSHVTIKDNKPGAAQFGNISKAQKMVGTFGEQFSIGSRTVLKKNEWEPFSLARSCMLLGKKLKFFLVHSLGQKVQFKV